MTVLNGMGVTGYITDLRWREEEVFGDGDVLDVGAEFSEILWPWSG